MKTTFIRSAILHLSFFSLLLSNVWAQSPQALNYQAVARNTSGTVIQNHALGIKVSIHRNSASGPVSYCETHTPTTNDFGLFTLSIGTGTYVSGGFDTIHWGNNQYWLQIEMDPSGSSAYTDMGTSQLLSVPYALYSKTSGAVSETDPVFLASPSYGITGTNISNWNTAFGWGNHSGLYTPVAHKTTEDAINGLVKVNGSGGYSAVADNSPNWNTAYSWGNHASAGYLTSYTETDPQVGTNTTNFLSKWNGTSLVTSSVFDNGRVGIGTTSPVARLHVADSSVVFTAYGYVPTSAGPLPVSGMGRRMMWYADKAAFRVGFVPGVNWDKDSIGDYSFAAGFDTKANGIISFASGSNSIASGNYGATAMGIYSTASGDEGSTSMGYHTTASGSYGATAIGCNNVASGTASMAFGYYTTASGGYGATSIGEHTTASGDYGSMAIGCNTTSLGSYGAIALGTYSMVISNAALAANRYTVANSYAEAVFGQYNDTATSQNKISWVNTDRLFEIGNGLSSTSRSNALTVLKNGRVGIGTTTPNTKLEVNGNIRQTTYSQWVSVPANGTNFFNWTHNLGYLPVIMLVKDQTAGGFMEYVEVSYQHEDNNQLTVFLSNRNASNTANGRIRWIIVY